MKQSLNVSSIILNFNEVWFYQKDCNGSKWLWKKTVNVSKGTFHPVLKISK